MVDHYTYTPSTIQIGAIKVIHMKQERITKVAAYALGVVLSAYITHQIDERKIEGLQRQVEQHSGCSVVVAMERDKLAEIIGYSPMSSWVGGASYDRALKDEWERCQHLQK